MVPKQPFDSPPLVLNAFSVTEIGLGTKYSFNENCTLHQSMGTKKDLYIRTAYFFSWACLSAAVFGTINKCLLAFYRKLEIEPYRKKHDKTKAL